MINFPNWKGTVIERWLALTKGQILELGFPYFEQRS